MPALKIVFRIILIITLVVGVFSILIAGFTGLYFYNRINRDLPQIEKLSDYKPKAVTKILSNDGTLLAEVWDERRYPVTFEEIPANVKNAFLAAEDSDFYEHGGIDIISIFRAAWVNLTSRATRQGASTITQQIVKQLLLSRERTYERKLKEALLAYRLEKYLSKDDILSMYLNQIFLGSGAYGIKAASRVHFRKELDELSIAEAAFLGGLPKKPSDYTRPSNFKMAITRQRYVLKQMFLNGFISKEEYKEALDTEINIFPQDEENLFQSAYYATHALKETEKLIQKISYDYTLRNPGGFTVRTSLDVKADKFAQSAMKKGLKKIDKRQGWRGPLGSVENDSVNLDNSLKKDEQPVPGEIYKAVVTSVSRAKNAVNVKIGEFEGEVLLSGSRWANTFAELETGASDIKRWSSKPINKLKKGDVIEVSVRENESNLVLELDQTPAVQGAVVLMNSATGEVLSLVGGYDYSLSKFNRATQAKLQPGSSFKPMIYLSAIESLSLTPSTLVPDEPLRYETVDGIWEPQNFDKKFLGPITLRVALQKSRNVVSVYLIDRLGVDKVIGTARRLGIESRIPRNMSIALGTPEVKVLEMVRSYTPFSSGGYLPETLIIKSIKERDGTEIYTAKPRQKKVVEPPHAFIMAQMMKGVVERGTAPIVKNLGVPVAGKTGTTNDHMDAWFIGYTPEWVAGVWVGFDVKRSLGRSETGGRAAAPIFLDLMQEFLDEKPPIDFIPPDGVIPIKVDVNTGIPVESKNEAGFIEYFVDNPENKDPKSFTNRYGELYLPRSVEGGDYLTNSDF